jgi:opacity protein-like surface antigen
MKKNIFIITGCAMLLSVSSIAYSAEGPYVSGNLGIAMASDSDLSETGATGTMEFDQGFAFGVAAGYGFGSTRVEGEIAYQKNDYDKLSINVPGVGSWSTDVDGDATSTAFLVNGYYDFKNNSSITPFIGAGLGFAKVDVGAISVPGFGTVTTSADDTVFAYQIGAGVGFAVNEKVSLDLKYRYFATSDPDFEGTEAEYSSHNLYAGVRVSF